MDAPRSAKDVRRELAALGARLANARAAEEMALREIAALATEALQAGLLKVEVSELAGISRVTLDRMLRGWERG